jgi:hypothetical protein
LVGHQPRWRNASGSLSARGGNDFRMVLQQRHERTLGAWRTSRLFANEVRRRAKEPFESGPR